MIQLINNSTVSSTCPCLAFNFQNSIFCMSSALSKRQPRLQEEGAKRREPRGGRQEEGSPGANSGTDPVPHKQVIIVQPEIMRRIAAPPSWCSLHQHCSGHQERRKLAHKPRCQLVGGGCERSCLLSAVLLPLPASPVRVCVCV